MSRVAKKAVVIRRKMVDTMTKDGVRFGMCCPAGRTALASSGAVDMFCARSSQKQLGKLMSDGWRMIDIAR